MNTMEPLDSVKVTLLLGTKSWYISPVCQPPVAIPAGGQWCSSWVFSGDDLRRPEWKMRVWGTQQETARPAAVQVLFNAREINCSLAKVWGFSWFSHKNPLPSFFSTLLAKQLSDDPKKKIYYWFFCLPQQYKFKRYAQVREQKLLLTPACWLAERNTVL